MSTEIKTIDQLDEGTYVVGINGISKVATCVHGNKYYAYQCADEADAAMMHVDLPEVIIEVSDDDGNHLPCGC